MKRLRSIIAVAAAPALLPMPREMNLTGGECAVNGEPNVEAVASVPPEGYELSVRPDGVTIRHSDEAGLFYAKKTLGQLRAGTTVGTSSLRTAGVANAHVPCLEIKDAPAFKWRGVMLDEGRHFFGKEMVVHNWRKPSYGIKAAERGHDVVVSDMRKTYYSVAQGVKDDPFTYYSKKKRLSLSTAYSFDPCAGMTDAARRHVLGAECCMWSECVWNEYDLAFKLWPRACAFAEVAWSAPAEPRDYADFERRMSVHRKRLIAAGVNCAPLK